MKYSYDTCGAVCASGIDVEVDDNGVVVSVKFHGGCPGNHAGISALVRGMKIEDVIDRLSGIRCGGRSTSCPDQLAKALAEVLKK